jgi:hypothetical protein
MSWKQVLVVLVGIAAIATLLPVTADAASHYFSQTKIVTALATGTGEADCPHGWHVTGGGVKTSGSVPSLGLAEIEDSYPTQNSTTRTQGWVVTLNAASSFFPMVVYADCVS